MSVERALPSAGSARSSEAPLPVNNNDSCQATAFAGCGKTRSTHVSVEERPLRGRVKHMESLRALAPVVVFSVLTDSFRSLFSDAAKPRDDERL